MVSFSCEVCNDTIIKKKLDQHKGRCRGAYFTCIDCNTTFQGTDYKAHTSCITEDEKYQGSLYKGNKKNQNKKNNQNGDNTQKSSPAAIQQNTPVRVEKPKDTKKLSSSVKGLEKLIGKNGQSLYKLLKTIDKAEKKEILKQLKVSKTDDGSLEISYQSK